MSDRELFLISGGSGGIGAAVCHAIKDRYAPVVAYQRNEAAAIEVARQTDGTTLQLDLTSDDSIRRAIDELSAQPKPLAGVILAASPPPALAPFSKTSTDEIKLQWRVNVLGPQQLLAGLIQGCFRKEKRGTVVGVLTEAMGDGCKPAAKGMAGYVIAKHGLAGVLACVAAEYSWLHVCSVKPGFTETRMLNAFDERFLALQRTHRPFLTASMVAEDIVKAINSPRP